MAVTDFVSMSTTMSKRGIRMVFNLIDDIPHLPELKRALLERAGQLSNIIGMAAIVFQQIHPGTGFAGSLPQTAHHSKLQGLNPTGWPSTIRYVDSA
jgi:hypothetical protein